MPLPVDPAGLVPNAEDDWRKTHSFRGSPSVRGWSKYQKTVEGWTLCGIARHGKKLARATEKASAVTCRYCRDLMQAKSSDRDQTEMRRERPRAAATSG